MQSNLRNIENCVEFLVSKQFPSGNFPSSLENETDKLYHWCHGAPGAVHLMVKAYQVEQVLCVNNNELKNMPVIWFVQYFLSVYQKYKHWHLWDTKLVARFWCEFWLPLSTLLWIGLIVIPLLLFLLIINGYKVFGKDKYLSAALKCGEAVWSRGILKKGYGICHGVAGNAYTFLCLYKQTGDTKWLHRAMKVSFLHYMYITLTTA